MVNLANDRLTLLASLDFHLVSLRLGNLESFEPCGQVVQSRAASRPHCVRDPHTEQRIGLQSDASRWSVAACQAHRRLVMPTGWY